MAQTQELVIIIIMPDKTRWAIPARFVAERRAAYYAMVDSSRGRGSYGERYAEELEHSMADHADLLDYAAGNLDWSEIVAHAVQLEDAPGEGMSYHAAWPNAEKEVVAMAMPQAVRFVPRPTAEVALTDKLVAWLIDQLLLAYPHLARGGEPSTSDGACAGEVLAALAFVQPSDGER